MPEGAWLVAINVEALYNSIPHDLGVRVVEAFISKRGSGATAYNEPKVSDQKVRLITRFSGQHRQVRNVSNKYWHLLVADDVVSKYVSPYPQITYRRSQSLKDHLVQVI